MTATSDKPADHAAATRSVAEAGIPAGRREALLQRQVQQLYNNALLGLVGSLGAAVLVSVLVMPYVDTRALTLWLSAIVAISLTRFVMVRLYFRSRESGRSAQSWLNRFVVTISISGLTWSLAGFLIHEPGQLLVATLLGLCIGGLVAGTTAAFSVHYVSILAFGVPAVLPYAFHLTQGDQAERLLSLALLLYSGVMLAVAYKVNRLAISHFDREIENESLIERLRNKSQEIAAFNSRLEVRVAERTQKLEQQIAARAQIESALRDSEARFRDIFENTGISILVTDLLGRIMDANSQACRTFGYTESEFLGLDLLGITHPDDRHQSRHELVVLASGEQSHAEFERRYVRAGGEVLWGMVNATATQNSRSDTQYLIIAIQNVSDAKLMARELAYQANHDNLTGLANRHMFESELQRLFDRAHTADRRHVLAYLDLDRFKIVNDACGHLAGDELLRQLGQILLNECREHDLVARLGGDEFGVLIENTELEAGLRIIQDLMRAIERFQFRWGDRVFSVGVSAGVVEINKASGSTTDAVRSADSACYVAKESGRNRIQVFDDSNVELRERRGQMSWINIIEHALSEDRFVLYAQPILPLAGTAHDGLHCEILLRMLDENEQPLLPGGFLPAAERYGLCPRIDAWVLQATYQALSDNPAWFERIGQCSINLSGQSLSDENLVGLIRRCTREHAAIVRKICFEITETSAISNLTRVRNLIGDLKVLGCRFALDDFGSGFSSYGYLSDLPVDYLKIDGKFVRDMHTNPIHHAMVRSINEIGHLMGKKTVAEFVENEAILVETKAINLDYAQGWRIGKPKPLAELLAAPSKPG